jgi:hypothetical protein
MCSAHTDASLSNAFGLGNAATAAHPICQNGPDSPIDESNA